MSDVTPHEQQPIQGVVKVTLVSCPLCHGPVVALAEPILVDMGGYLAGDCRSCGPILVSPPSGVVQ